MVSTNRSLEDAFRLIRRMSVDVFANGRCVLLGCGGQDCDVLVSRPFSSGRRSGQNAAFGKEKEQWYIRRKT